MTVKSDIAMRNFKSNFDESIGITPFITESWMEASKSEG
jgi:hypothetical protein